MRQRRSWPLSNRHGASSAVLVFLLAVAAVAGDSGFVTSLRGYAVETGARRAPALGYYEALINTAPLDRPDDNPRPPAGWLPFGGTATGIVRELREYVRWEMRPNLDLCWNGTRFRTNTMGFRTPEVSLEKPAGTYRILVFGSSNTMGYGVNDHEAYPRILERWLNQRSTQKRRVEVVNLAVAGDSPSRKLARLQKEAARWSADWLLCDASVLDPWLENTHVHAVLQRAIPIPFPFVHEAISRSGVSANDSLEKFRDKFRGESEQLISGVYAEFSAVSRRLRVPLTVVILPRADGETTSARAVSAVRSLSGANGLEFLDLSAAFDRMAIEEFRISDWDKHPSARGHEAIFEALRAAIIGRGGLPGVAPGAAR
jgi:lysophospholipase L1-like esterase